MRIQAKDLTADRLGVLRHPVLATRVLEDLAHSDVADIVPAVKSHLADNYVREAIYLASPSLYKKICAWESGDGDFNEIIASTARYILRMAYRATPFGTFSCVSSISAGVGATSLFIGPRIEMTRRAQIDAASLVRLAVNATNDPALRDQLRFSTNDTLARANGTVTLTAFDRNKKLKRVYRKVELELDPHLDAVIRIAEEPRRVAEIAAMLHEQFPDDCSIESAADFVWQLVSAQVLCADHLVNFSSNTPLTALTTDLGTDSKLGKTASDIRLRIESLNGVVAVDPLSAYEPLSDLLNDAGVRPERGVPVKVDLIAKSGPPRHLSRAHVNKLEKAVAALTIVKRKSGKLGEFARNFADFFGEAEVPLSFVVDRLESLGFSERESAQPPLSRMIRRTMIDGTPEASLSEEILGVALSKGSQHYVDVTHVVDEGNYETFPDKLPLTIVPWISLWKRNGIADSVIELRSVGSQEPGRVMGRFAYDLPEVAEYLRESCRFAPHPVVEIVHQPEDRLGNICARPSLSDYEFRIRAGASETAKSLSIEDLIISVVRGRVCVRSVSLNSQISLRMSNAHAFDKPHNLAVYRFLNLVSNQDYSAELACSAKGSKGFYFTPGLKYDGVIFSRPTWRIPTTVLASLRRVSRHEAREMFREHAKSCDMPEWIAVGERDNHLPIKLTSNWMVDQLIKQALKLGDCVITDLYPEGMQPFAESPTGPHFHEIQLALRANSRGTPQQERHAALAEHSVAQLWSEWAFFKLYAVPNHHLACLNAITPPLNQLAAEGRIRGFFFVRYGDAQGTHLRVRIQSESSIALPLALDALAPALRGLYDQGLVTRVEADPYVREVSRYGGDERLAICEQIFFADSKLVIDALGSVSLNGLDSWHRIARSVDSMLCSLGVTALQDRLDFAKTAAGDFAREFSFGSSQRKAIGNIFKATGPLHVDSTGLTLAPRDRFEKIVLEGASQIGGLWSRYIGVLPPLPRDRLYGVRWSLIHMRMNRLIERDHRIQEAVIWELLKRSYLSLSHRREGVIAESINSG